jgi:hypothetical protein
MLDFNAEERMRIEFHGDERPGFYDPQAGFVPLDPAQYTDAVEQSHIHNVVFSSPARSLFCGTFAYTVIAFLVGVVIAVSVGMIWFKLKLSDELDEDTDTIKVGNILGGMCAGVVITVLNIIFSGIAETLTNWENHRTDTQHENALVRKLFAFNFVNSYLPLFWVAFIAPSASVAGALHDPPQPDTMTALAVQLGSMLTTRQITAQIIEMSIPFVKRKLRERKGDVELVDLPRHEREQRLLPFEGTIGEFTELVVQFGYVTMFTAAFPPAAIFAMLNNIYEIRLDSRKILTTNRRPFPTGAADIGTFLHLVNGIGFLAVAINFVLIGFVSTQLRDQYTDKPLDNFTMLLVVVIAEHVMVLAKAALGIAIPDTPAWVARGVALNKHEMGLRLGRGGRAPLTESAVQQAADRITAGADGIERVQTMDGKFLLRKASQ